MNPSSALEPLSQGAIVAFGAFPTNCFKRNHRQTYIPHTREQICRWCHCCLWSLCSLQPLHPKVPCKTNCAWYQYSDENLYTPIVSLAVAALPSPLRRLCPPRHQENKKWSQFLDFCPLRNALCPLHAPPPKSGAMPSLVFAAIGAHLHPVFCNWYDSIGDFGAIASKPL